MYAMESHQPFLELFYVKASPGIRRFSVQEAVPGNPLVARLV